METIILGIESSCDDTSAAIIKNGILLSNITANQDVHKKYGGVVPELASRAHQANIIPVVDIAIKESGVNPDKISAIAFTRGPGLMGSLLVGSSFAKGFALAKSIPLIDVNHLHGHISALFLKEKGDSHTEPKFPFLTLLVSGGNSQIIVVKDFFNQEIIGETIDDAAGEAFDKCAKVMGLEYPGGPLVDKYAKDGNPDKFVFSKPKIEGLNYSFSGLKTSFLYFVRDNSKDNTNFVKENLNDLCASIQKTIIDVLLNKLISASQETQINEIAIAGGVSANSGLRQALTQEAKDRNWKLHIPKFKYTTDNAAMIAITGYHKHLKKIYANQSITADSSLKI